MFEFIRKRLSRTILCVLAVSVALTMIALIYMSAARQTGRMLEETLTSSEDIAHTVYAGIKHPMSIGDSAGVENQLIDIKEERKDMDVLICDFEQRIIYATQPKWINSKVSDYISSRTFLQALDESLKKGEHPLKALEEETQGQRYITTVHPISNNKECYHCHGSSRKVLGGMIVRKAAEKNYTAIASLRNYNILLSIAGITAITILMYIILLKLVKQPLLDFTGKIDELTARIPEGDYSARIEIRRNDEIGNLIASFNHMSEILDQKNKALNNANKKLTAAYKELEGVAYSVSHDLRAPLRGIDGFSKIVLDEYSKDLEENCKHYLNRIRDNTTRMSVLIDDILMFSRAGRTELRMGPAKLTEIVKNSLVDFREEIEARNINVNIGKLPILNCDMLLMQAVFSNLISNAVKFTRNNKENPEIIMGFDEMNETIFIKDNGIGFDMQYHDKIFGVFQRLHLPEEYDGTGIGLAIVKRIVERHRWKIWAESELGNGTTFFIKLNKGEQS